MKKKVIHLSYFYIGELHETLPKSYSSRKLYFSHSIFIILYIYRHLYYALNLPKIDDGKIILDLGCGDGPFFPTLNRYGKRIIGLDHSLQLILKAKTLIRYIEYPLKKVLLLNADGQYIPIKDKSIDIIYCLETFEHVPNTNRLISEIFRILKDTGELIYSIPIEIGISLILRQFIGKITKFPRETYKFKELLVYGLLKKTSSRIHNRWSHKNFDWRIIQRLIGKKFKIISQIYSPFPFLKGLNPTIIFKVSKLKSN